MIQVIRYVNAPFGTYGDLIMPEFRCLTVERPWLDNKVNDSCIPPGVYRVEETVFRGKYKTLEVMDVPGRTAIKVHVANVPGDLLGCIGLGRGWGFYQGVLSVTDSQDIFNEWWSVVQQTKPRTIEIRYAESPSGLQMPEV